MSDTLPELIVLAIGGSIAPPLLLLTILFLGSRRPLFNASALALGYFITCAGIGILGLVLFGGAESAVSTVGRVISVSVGALLVVFGIRSLLNAPDPDAPPPRWIESINAMSPPRAFGFGMALFPLQVKNLAIFVACIELIIASNLSPQGSISALMLVLVIFAIPILALIGLYAAVPQQASTTLGSLQTWMGNNSRAITVVLCFCSERSSSSEGSRDRKSMRTHPRPVMGTFAGVIPRTTVALVALMVSAYLPQLPCARGKRVGKDTSSLAFHNLGVSHIPGTRGG
jgi:hypothetical protein